MDGSIEPSKPGDGEVSAYAFGKSPIGSCRVFLRVEVMRENRDCLVVAEHHQPSPHIGRNGIHSLIKDIDKSLIGDAYLPAWEKFGLFGLKCRNDEPTIRAYSMANYPAEGDRIMLTVRIATPPFKPKPQVGFMDVMPGIASSYIFTLKLGDKVLMSGPYGDFHPIFDSKREMMWIGGGAGMAPLRAQIMHMLRTLHTTDRRMNYFYGARALNEVFYLDDFLQLEREFPNFRFHLALDRPDPAADAAGVKYTAGFVHQVIYETYLKEHEAPEDIEYYMCGPGPMSRAVEQMLDSLGVPMKNLMFDNFG